MEELFELRSYIEKRQYNKALNLIGEMEEMSRDDKINKIASLLEILLLHSIKQQAEKRTTKSWEASVKNALRQIVSTNKPRKAGGYYLGSAELQEAISESFERALTSASLEVFEGQFDESDHAEMIDKKNIKQNALEMILQKQEEKYS